MKKATLFLLGIGIAISTYAQFSTSSGEPYLPKQVADRAVEQQSVSDPDSAVATLPDSAVPYTPSQDNTILLKRKYHTYIVANQDDVAHIYRSEGVVKKNCFFVISKQEYRLYVYEVVGKDTVLDASFPICYAIEKGPKTKTGDNSTPECSMAHPARISEIKDASSWCFDFKDGRGNIRAFGHWFMRLDLSQSDCHPGCRSNRSIGIHGSTNNNASVPGRDSHGCVRLRDKDLLTLHDLYAQVGTKVVIKPGKSGKLPFELSAEKACNGYVAPAKGYKEH